jgi:hypothetical protein
MQLRQDPFDALIEAIARHRTHHRAVGILVEGRRLTPASAEEYLRRRAVVLGVSVAVVAALTVGSCGGQTR